MESAIKKERKDSKAVVLQLSCKVESAKELYIIAQRQQTIDPKISKPDLLQGLSTCIFRTPPLSSPRH